MKLATTVLRWAIIIALPLLVFTCWNATRPAEAAAPASQERDS